jgi:hypothetical protein
VRAFRSAALPTIEVLPSAKSGKPGYFSLLHKRCAFGGDWCAFGIMECATEFPFPQRDQPLLLPVDMREWLPEGDLVFVVLDAVGRLGPG